MLEHMHWINGKLLFPDDGVWLERRSPADGQLIAKVALGGKREADLAVAAARRAFDQGPWTKLAGNERGKILGRLADLMEADLERFAQLEAVEAGKPITAARVEISMAVNMVRYAAALCWNNSGRLVTDAGVDKMGLVMHEPRGVAGLIVAWNYPVLCLMQKLPYALAAGCSVVVKPSEFTAGTTLEVVKLAEHAGVPPGQINVVTGTGELVGEAITDNPDVNMISFTGSSKVGKRVAAKCAARFCHYTLELGGKGSNIIFADADIDRAVEATYVAYTFNKGEECCSSAKILVEESIAEEFIEKLLRRSGQARVGMPLDESVDMGPMVHEGQMNRVLSYINEAKASGARVLIGGERATGNGMEKGFFVQPTIFVDVKPDMPIFQEEIFGPVACIATFKTVDEAIAIANNTSYGLANGVWTGGLDKAMQVVKRLRSGLVYVNTYFETLVQLPFGGMKDSGKGYENGAEGLQEFMHTRSAFIRLTTV